VTVTDESRCVLVGLGPPLAIEFLQRPIERATGGHWRILTLGRERDPSITKVSANVTWAIREDAS